MGRLLTPTEIRRVEAALRKWEDARLYRRPARTIDEAATDMGLRKRLFYGYFEQVLQEDFRTWRTKLRIRDARQLLLEERELSSRRVGELVGFSDRSNFTRQFERHVGCTPGEWRLGAGLLPDGAGIIH